MAKEALEPATLEWRFWFNHHRLLEPLAEAGANHYRQLANPAHDGMA